jgi:hypothetical protein
MLLVQTQMRLVRSDSPEVVRCTESANVLASRRWPALAYGLPFGLTILFISIVLTLLDSAQSTAWLGMFFFLTWSTYVLWLTKSSRRNWCAAVCAGQVYLRPSMTRGTAPNGIGEPDVFVFEASEITSISIRTVEAYLYGPKPKLAECLVIELGPTVAESVHAHIPSPLRYCETLGCCGEPGSNYLARATYEDGRLAMSWRQCHPNVRVFVRQVVQECPSLSIGPEERSELDLNSIWGGVRLNDLDVQQRRSLLQAKRLGFDSDFAWRLSIYKQISSQEAQAYLAELEQEEAGTKR